MRSLGNSNFNLSAKEELISKRNRLLFTMRRTLAFRRAGYKEEGCENAFTNWMKSLSPQGREDALFILNKFHFHPWIKYLSLPVMQKNLATLWILESVLGKFALKPEQILEPGCQDFNRLPATYAFFRNRGVNPAITGLELDPYRVLSKLYSRHDLAQYYRSLVPEADTEYFGGDFFGYRPSWPADLILAFYPFVSPHPALAWGLPEEYGNPMAWLHSISENLRENGLALVLHQGSWEEEEFDEALQQTFKQPLEQSKNTPLKLLHREILLCPFYPEPHPAHASLYTRTSSC